MAKEELTHLDAQGHAHMVDVGGKAPSARSAEASARVRMQPATMQTLIGGTAPKGDVLAAARIAGIQAAKRTPELIPLCHAIQLTGVDVELTPNAAESCLEIRARVRALDRTGAEMEALTAAAIAALTVYDMLKAIDRGMTVEELRLEHKSGGKSGAFAR